MTWNPQLILGSPGTGKTTRLMQIVNDELESGVRPSEIALLTFTKAGADVFKEKAAAKFGFDPKKDLPYFRTIHSLAYREMGVGREEVMAPRDWREFSKLIGYNLTGFIEQDGVEVSVSRDKIGDAMLRIIEYATATSRPLKDAWEFIGEAISWHQLLQFSEAFKKYKIDAGKMDFSDMVENYAATGKPLPIRVGAIDEAQDLTRSQWNAVRKAFANVERLYIVGDDDQAIYKWAGADIETFLSLSDNPTVLPRSHRLPRQVHHYAKRISDRIAVKYEKPYAPRDAEGVVEHYMQPEDVDISSGDWLLLARNSYHLMRLADYARDSGFTYSFRGQPSVKNSDVDMMYLWEEIRAGKVTEINAKQVRLMAQALGRAVPAVQDHVMYSPSVAGVPLKMNLWHESLLGIDEQKREYYIACLRTKEKLKEKPRIRIETIHGVKGEEASNVMVLSDVTAKTRKGLEIDPDAEHRVFYVACTRAIEGLHIVAPQGDSYYEMPH